MLIISKLLHTYKATSSRKCKDDQNMGKIKCLKKKQKYLNIFTKILNIFLLLDYK